LAEVAPPDDNPGAGRLPNIMPEFHVGSLKDGFGFNARPIILSDIMDFGKMVTGDTVGRYLDKMYMLVKRLHGTSGQDSVRLAMAPIVHTLSDISDGFTDAN
jgi:hypothetical protein